MKISPPLSACCSTCGCRLNPTGDCLACLLQIGFEKTEAAPDSLVLGDFEVARRDDGSLWELGHGAMGITYRASDTVLHRQVALKVIDLTTPREARAGRERFLREARAAAALRHPNVASIFHFGTAQEIDRCYYAMELVEGETLQALVRREGPLQVEAALEIAIQIARALIAAAAQNLIHRDLKPANIMLKPDESGASGPEVKVIDFGLARVLAETECATDLTQGGFVGTPSFASPEQFAGRPADARSDIYSLGVTLWYALTGEVPFPGKTIEEIRQRQTEGSLPVAELVARKVPNPVISLLTRTLALDPAQRPASPRDLLTALQACRVRLPLPNDRKRWRRRLLFAGVALLAAALCALLWQRLAPTPKALFPTAREQSIAVLPFANRSEKQADAFFADGIQDDLISSLVTIDGLKVISRSSVTNYRDPKKRDLRAIGQQLGVAHVFEGEVQRIGDRVRLHVQLSETAGGRRLWAERYDRALPDSLGLQDEIALEVASALGTRLVPEEKRRLGEKPTNNPEAYVVYLQGLAHERASQDKSDIIEADRLYRQAVALDPSFALAHARLSIVNSLMFHFSADFPHDPARKTKARAAAGEALRLAPTLGEAHLALGHYFYRGERDYTAALREFSLAAKALPNDPDILSFSAWIFRRQNRWREALAALERAQTLDPRNALFDLPKTYLMVRDWPGAEVAAHRLLEIEPNSGFGLTLLAYLEVVRHRDPAAGRALLEKIPGTRTITLLDHWKMLMLQRDFSAAEKILAGQVLEFSPTNSKGFYEGCTALARGDKAAAQRFFEEARPFYETQVRDHREVGGYHANLGLVYAYLGRKGEAIRESRRAVELLPENSDALDGPVLANNLALVYARTGEPEQAVALIERLLTTPGAGWMQPSMTLAELSLDWEWDPLRSNPRFRKILAAREPKTIY